VLAGQSVLPLAVRYFLRLATVSTDSQCHADSTVDLVANYSQRN